MADFDSWDEEQEIKEWREREAAKRAQEAKNKPLEAIAYIKGANPYLAHVWQTRSFGLNDPIVRYTYWIIIVDTNFAGREIKDSVEDPNTYMNLVFKDQAILDIKGFLFKHFAGNVFRIKFDIDAKDFSVKMQYLDDINIGDK